MYNQFIILDKFLDSECYIRIITPNRVDEDNVKKDLNDILKKEKELREEIKEINTSFKKISSDLYNILKILKENSNENFSFLDIQIKESLKNNLNNLEESYNLSNVELIVMEEDNNIKILNPNVKINIDYFIEGFIGQEIENYIINLSDDHNFYNRYLIKVGNLYITRGKSLSTSSDIDYNYGIYAGNVEVGRIFGYGLVSYSLDTSKNFRYSYLDKELINDNINSIYIFGTNIIDVMMLAYQSYYINFQKSKQKVYNSLCNGVWVEYANKYIVSKTVKNDLLFVGNSELFNKGELAMEDVV